MNCREVAAVLWLGTAVSCSHSTTRTISDTPAGRAFTAWLDAYNSADSARLDAYVRQYEPTMSVHTQLAFRQQTGRWAVASVQRSDRRHIELVLRTTSDSDRAYASTLVMYGIVDVTDSATPQATTTLTRIGNATFAPVRRISAAQRGVVIDSVMATVARNYVVPSVAQRVADSLRARRARGAYDDDANEVGFAHRLNADLVALSADKALGVEYAWEVPLPPPVPAPPAMIQCGFEPPSVLGDSVGYVKFYGLENSQIGCGQDISAAMTAVARTRALIIDVRESTSGESRMVSYVGAYLVAGCVHLSDHMEGPTARAEKMWTLDGLPGVGFGGSKPLYILTSARTQAAAEELAFDLQRRGRATIVGETTAGSAHVTAVGQVGSHLLLHVPVKRVVDPNTGANWQGVGVEPDVKVPAGDALVVAQRLIREHHAPRIPLAGAADAGVQVEAHAATGMLHGIRFAIDTLEHRGEERGALSRVVGVVEFAGGRGRLDVSAVRRAPMVERGGVVIGEPMAKPGDYYLFDNAGFVLVRPAARTFASFLFTRAEFNHTGALLPGAFMFANSPLRTDTIDGGNVDALWQHGPISLHWHMQSRTDSSLRHLYARGWLEIQDAPAAEAGVARWFEIAAALGTKRDDVARLAPDDLQVTSVVLLHPSRQPEAYVHAGEMLNAFRLAVVDVAPARLTLPAAYTEARWPGFARVSGVRTLSSAVSARWRTLDDESSQRARATCREAWVPELRHASQ